jgi:ferredoxin
MPRITIDGREIEVADGATILDAAQKLGIEIPTICFLRGCKPSTSCMVCVVKVRGLTSLVPACGAVVRDGMEVENNIEEVRDARKAALELLLSDHLGDCMGPCQVACPAHIEIPLMIRQIEAGRLRNAIATVKRDIALPAVLGRICPKPCEKVCRRGVYDEAVSICLLKRFVADVDLDSKTPYLPVCRPFRDKRAAIVGAGPAGLAAAYYLRQKGLDCVIFDDHDEPGGMLLYGISEERLPKDVIRREAALIIEGLGVKFSGRTRIGNSVSMQELCKDFDAVFVAVGELQQGGGDRFGLATGKDGIKIDSGTYATSLEGVFAGGDAVRRRRLTVRAVADGKEAADSITQYLSGQSVVGEPKPFNIHIGQLKEGEIDEFVVSAGKARRLIPIGQYGGYTEKQAKEESARCIGCDCRKAQYCKLRQWAAKYGAKPTRYKGTRRLFSQSSDHPSVVYEPGKCIDCGLCIQVATQAGEQFGLTFVGRGFDVRVKVPFEKSLAEGLKISGANCVEACPTGALAFKDRMQSGKR